MLRTLETLTALAALEPGKSHCFGVAEEILVGGIQIT